MMNTCRNSRLGAVIYAALLGVSAVAGSSPRSPELLDRIVAFVDDDAILWSELNTRLIFALQQEGMLAMPSEAEIERRRGEILDAMLEERILISKARWDSVQIDASRVEEVLNDEFGRIKTDMEPEDFTLMLERSGLSERQLKNRYRKQIRHQLLSEQFISELAFRQFITRADVDAFRAAHGDTLPSKISYSHIQLKVQPEQGVLDAALEKISAIRVRVESGEPFAEVAREASEDSATRSGGGDFGCFTLGSLGRPRFELAADRLQLGQLSDPVLTKFGYHLILIAEKRDGEVCGSHILVRAPSTAQDTERTLAQLSDLRDLALAGKDFAQLATDHSANEVSSRRGGLWNIVSKGAVPPELDGVISSLNLGEISEPFVLLDAAHILKINDDYATLEGLVREQRVNQLMSELIASHREEIHVEVRLDEKFLWQDGDATY